MKKEWKERFDYPTKDSRSDLLKTAITTDDILDNIYDTMDGLACDGRFEDIDNIIKVFPFKFIRKESHLDIVVGILTSTFPMRKKLEWREWFFDQAITKITEMEGEEKAKEILKGLEQ